MHPRNLHNNAYNFSDLVKALPALSKFVISSPKGRETIDFANPLGVKTLNAALLKYYYKIDFWDIPKGYLCPPVPGRADYIHVIADLIGGDNKPLNAKTVRGLDIGTGANLIYPIIGSQAYGWDFVASDIDEIALKSAMLIQSSNSVLKNKIKIRRQSNPTQIFQGLVNAKEQFTFSMCNPPFHASAQEATAGSQRKNRNLHRNKLKRNPAGIAQSPAKAKLNFAGQNNELWCKGGELEFIKDMVRQSLEYKEQIKWFTTLVSKKDNLEAIQNALKAVNPAVVKIVNMEQGSKISRIVAWQF